MMKAVKTVDAYIDQCENFQDIAIQLRKLLQDSEMVEDIKWGQPSYSLDGKNVLGFGEFKNYIGIWFHQGVFFKDVEKRLVNAQEDKTKGMRQYRLHSIDEFKADIKTIRAYVQEAIQNQKAGKMIRFEKKSRAVVVPEHLKQALESDASLKAKFNEFSPSKQREFCEFIETAKREETKLSRLEKISMMILDGMGLNDKYR